MTNYVDKASLYEAMVRHRARVVAALADGREPPEAERYIGEAIMLICSGVARKPNFAGYSYREDMVAAACVDCSAAINKFNPDKSDNPFWYFSRIAINAFIRYLNDEKVEQYVKCKNYENQFLNSGLMTDEDGAQLESNEFREEIIRSFEDRVASSRRSRKTGATTS
jgi:DNA-directed RNA polymerase specialized sigma subunit